MINPLSLSLLLAAFPGGDSSSPVSVVHGSPVESSRPIAKAIVRFPTSEGETGCTGTLVSPLVAVTAGHCVRGGFAAEGSAVQTIGSPERACARAVVKATAYVPGAEPEGVLMLPDLALVRLDHAPCGTIPASLPASGSILEGDELIAAGFGVGSDTPTVPDELRIRFLPQTAAALLAEYQGEDSQWTDMVAKDFTKYSPYYLFALPAGDYGTICGGDSGGPVFAEKEGIATLFAANGAILAHPTKGIPACGGAYLQLVSPLAPYLGWIHSQIEDWNKKNRN